MDALAKLIWNPLMCLIYLETGVLFLCFTKALAWKNSFKVCINIFRNDKSNNTGKFVSHSKAFLATILATVGVGNLAGVGTAIHLGGPGALFWMWITALFGMCFKMAETYFVIKHAPEDIHSLAFATPMAYLERYVKGIWRFVPVLVAGLIFIQGVVLSNLVQSNSLAHAIHTRFGTPNVILAVVVTFFVGLAVLGGLKRIVDVTSAIAPFMIIIFVVTGLIILISDPLRTLKSICQVIYYAFTPCSIAGGISGYAVLQAMQFGVSRGVFSHMSGLGTSTFLQGANEEPPATGAFMAAVVPFIDTIIICTVSGLVILSTPLWQSETGGYLALGAFELGLGSVGEYTIISCLIIFAYTTIVAFCHVSERCFYYLGGKNYLYYRIFFLAVTFAGPFLNLNFVWSLSDLIIAMILIFHLLPLLGITISNRKTMMADLNDYSQIQDNPAASGETTY